jgi:hypothetical protein
LPASTRAEAQKVLDKREDFRARARLISERRIYSLRIRIHDDLGLNRVLHTGKDFVFIGFDGRSDRTLGGRRIKRSPLRDVASMLLSFQYAAQAVFFDQLPGVTAHPETANALEFWARYWSDWVSAAFLKAYLDGSAKARSRHAPHPGTTRTSDCFWTTAFWNKRWKARVRSFAAGRTGPEFPSECCCGCSKAAALKSYPPLQAAGVHEETATLRELYEAPRNTTGLHAFGHLSPAVQ